MRHRIERFLVGLLLLTSLVFASKLQWGPAGYFLFLAAFVDFDDWTGSTASGNLPFHK
jgi:hypothetical protein